MEQIVRPLTPSYLERIWGGVALHIRKGKQWKTNYKINRNAGAFQWGTVTITGTNHRLYDLLITDLCGMSINHCFYCDRKQVVKGGVRPTIDHFHPKTKVPIQAYSWRNLFLSCDTCQGYKKDLFYRNDLLKFDLVNYNFDDYYMLDFVSGKVLTRPDISWEQRRKARLTLTILGVNKDGRDTMRLEELEAFTISDPLQRVIDRFSFRYFIQRTI
jgi:uncharacterized protein (TIGR02646 family)